MDITITSRKDPDYPGALHRHLWLLVGGGDYHNGSYAFYLGPDSDIDNQPIAESYMDDVIESAKSKGIALSTSEIRDTLNDYRADR